MDKELLSNTAAAMLAKGKGILAADESSGTCETRFKTIGVECTEENRRTYRGLLFTTPGVEQFLSGAERAAASMPIRLPAPGLFSTKNCCPKTLVK